MATIAVTYTFSNSTTADATQVNHNFQDIIDGTSDGTKSFVISALTCGSTATFNGNVLLGDASADDIQFNGSLATSIPIKTTATYDFGSSTKGLLSIYLGNSTFTTRLQTGATASYTLKLPPTAGSTGYIPYNSDGAGTLTWSHGQTGIKTVTAGNNYAILDGDGYSTILLATGSSSDATVTMPAPANNTGRVIKIKKTDSGTKKITVTANSGELFDGAASKILIEQNDFISLTTDGTNWFILDLGGTTKSHVRVEVGNGHGSGSTSIRRFTTSVVAIGNAITYADSSTLGGTFTINQDGVYSISFSDRRTNNGDADFGISLNSNQLTTSIISITNTTRIAATYLPGATNASSGGLVTACLKLSAADVIRAHTDGTTNDTTARVAFSISRICPC